MGDNMRYLSGNVASSALNMGSTNISPTAINMGSTAIYGGAQMAGMISTETHQIVSGSSSKVEIPALKLSSITESATNVKISNFGQHLG